MHLLDEMLEKSEQKSEVRKKRVGLVLTLAVDNLWPLGCRVKLGLKARFLDKLGMTDEG